MASPPTGTVVGYSLSSSPTLQHASAIGIAIIAVLTRWYVCRQTHFTADDALIALRYAENVATGRGLVYTPGGHVLAVPGPLYVLLLSMVPPHFNALLVGKACCIRADGVTCYLLARLMARSDIARPIEGLFAATIYAFATIPIVVSISGTETGIATCVGMAMVCAYADRRPYWLYTLGAALFLLRFDGLVLFVILASALGLRERKLPLRAGAIFLIITIPWLIFATAYFGSPIPETSLPALTVEGHGPAGAAPLTSIVGNIQGFAAQFGFGWVEIGMCLLFVLGTILVVCQAFRRAERGIMTAPLIWCLVYLGLMMLSHIPMSPGALLPVVPVIIAIACLAGATAPIKLGKMRQDLASKWAGRAVPAALGLVILLATFHIRSIVTEIGRSYRHPGRISPSSSPEPIGEKP